ncbi:MAG: carbon storage regulator CsrA [Lachnospiraceae bacterium]|nr:carbon storage regulator CsrA [Lachnospiraceae bacterium]MCI5587466.1 carbon storage regulator CsrA [Lachnospiraceae bacterium]
MLALARKVNESIVIGNDIEVTILEIKGDQIKIGIDAPKSVPIYRKEIYVQIQEENKKAAEEEIDVSALKNVFKDSVKKTK